MPFRNIPQEIKVKTVLECLEINNDKVKEAAEKYGISEVTIKRNCEKVLNSTNEIIKTKKPGPIAFLKKNWKNRRHQPEK